MSEFLRAQFDKLLLVGMILFFSSLLLHMHAHSATQENRELVQFFRETCAGFVGALLGAITAQLTRRPPAESATLTVTQETGHVG